MLNFLSMLLPTMAKFTAGVSEKNPKTTAWATLGLGVAGVLGYLPEEIHSALTTIAYFFFSLANMIPG